MFEADVMDGTQPCFPFLLPDFEEIERNIVCPRLLNRK